MTKQASHHHPHKESHKSSKSTSELLKEVSFEDKLWILWNEYSRYLILIVAILIFAFLGYKGIEWYKGWQVEKMQNEFRDAKTQGREMELAEKNIKEPIAGTVFTAAADKLVDEKLYEEALKNYKKALKSLDGTPVGDRVHLGIAMVTFMKGDQKEGKELLKKLVHNQSYLDAIRAEAAYQLIFINLQEKNYSEAKDFITAISQLPNGGIWTQKALVLQESVPELSSNA